ncbi:hypothetical protein BH11ARM2_BH11ARM2_06560 [soil metagenome]
MLALLIPFLLAASPEDEAASLLQKADETLASARTLRARYTDTAEYAAPYRDLRQTGTVTLARPDGVRVEITRARRVRQGEPWKDTGNNTLRVGDDTAQYAVFFHPESTQVRKIEPLPKPGVNESPLLAGFFGGTTSPYAAFSQARDKGALGEVRVEGQKIDYRAGKTQRTVEIGADGLVHRLVEKEAGSGDVRTWELETIDLDPEISATAFRYEPPANALPYDRSQSGTGLAIGSVAPDISLGDVDGKRLRLGDLKGKVVVLKFWATWCWPCNQSFPETEALAAKLQGEGVETVAVAIKDSRKGLDLWRKRHPQIRHVAFAFEDPSHPDASTAFGIAATPTVYVIDREGRVVAHTEGYTGPNPALEEAVREALKR